MSNKVNQHYIPQFYLKRFSINDNKSQIGLFNLKSKIYVQAASLKHQASQNYFYGKDNEIEEDLMKLESEIGFLFNYWTEKKELLPPPENSASLILLKRYVLYQMYRTPKAANLMNEGATLALQAYLALTDSPDKEKNRGSKLIYENAVSQALYTSTEHEYLLGHLHCRFVVNLSDTPFITSDSPVVLYNQFLEKQGMRFGITALAVKGLQIFFPIHPRLMIYFYDPYVYEVKCRNCTSTESIIDVNQLNGLQYLNSYKQLFFNELIDKEYCESLQKTYSSERLNQRRIMRPIKTADGRNLVLSTFEEPLINLRLSFTKTSSAEKCSSFPLPLRHKNLERNDY